MSKYFFALICVFTLHFNGFSQSETKEENERKRFEREMKEKKAEYIQNLVDDLNVDDFQKEIITQKLDSYYDEVAKIYKLNVPTFQKKQLVLDLGPKHFEDIKAMVSEEVMVKILEGARGENQDKDKKKRKNKRKNKN